MNSNEPPSSSESAEEASTKPASSDEKGAAVELPGTTDSGKQAGKKERERAGEGSQKGREAAGEGAQGDRAAAGQGVRHGERFEHAREVGASGFVSSAPFLGGGEIPRRLLLIGLDGATPELAIGAWRTQLRSMQLLTDRGMRGRLHGSLPWSRLPNSLSLLSGQDPGQLGIFGAQRRPNHSYAAPVPIDGHAMHEPRLWDMLAQRGKHVGVIGAPATTPVPAIHAHMIGDGYPSSELAIHPPALRQQVERWMADEPPLRVAEADQIDQLVGNTYADTEQRFRLARRMLARETYDCFIVYDDGIATVQHALWDSLDTTHLRYTPNHPDAATISAYYRFVDDQVADLLELIDDDTIVAIVSACGAQPLDGELALNDWLIAQGDLVLHAPPEQAARLEDCAVDWEHTRAWAGNDGAIYLKIAGREPQGHLTTTAVEPFIADLTARLRALVSPAAATAGERPAVEVYRPAALYAAIRGVAPDLLAICTQPGWRPSALLGRGSPWLSTTTTPMDAAYESPVGFFVCYDPHHFGGGLEIEAATIYDIVPTLLGLLGQPIPARLRGRALLER